MDFNYTEEQQLLKDSLEKFLEKNYSFEQRRDILTNQAGFSPTAWQGFSSMGLLALPIPEEFGGFGGNGVDVMIVMEAFGRWLVLEPYLANAVLAAGAVALAGSATQRQALLPRIADGSMKFAFAHIEPDSRFDLHRVATTARQEAGMWVITGRKSVVIHGAIADLLIVTARTSGAADAKSGISLFFVNPAEEGVAGRDYPTYDGMRAAEVTFDNVTISPESLIGAADSAYPLLELLADRAVAALCAEAVGCMGALTDMTLAYLKTREQFGVPIGRFQALQHRMVDMLMHYENAKSMAMLAAVKVDSSDYADRRRAVSAAKELIGRAGRFVGQQAIQLHGGMGMTDELAVGHYVKRLTAIDTAFGNSDHHLDRFTSDMQETIIEPAQPKKKWKQLV
jgi:alkylation response protein AidB-like acyl-CoA dehydrogenase